MKRKAQQHTPPAQQAVNELWQVLGAQSNPEAVESARELVQAVTAEPLFMTVVLNRTTGAFVFNHNLKHEWGEDGIKQLREVLQRIDNGLVASLAKLAEARGKAATTEKTEG